MVDAAAMAENTIVALAKTVFNVRAVFERVAWLTKRCSLSWR